MKNNYLYLQGSILQLKDSLDSFARGLSTTEELQSELDNMSEMLQCQSHSEIIEKSEI